MRKLNWDKQAARRTRARRANDPSLPILGEASKRCWCGDIIGHNWTGKAAGNPHPQEGQK